VERFRAQDVPDAILGYNERSNIVSLAEDIDRAASALRQGRLVAFPTETVYGLGADAENRAAVARIFQVKGRPANHPLIVHIGSASALDDWAARVPPSARRLAEACWPGPLTLLLEKSPRVPHETTGGLDSVGLRVPAHPVALELLRRFGGGIAAPSANRFGHVSPTSAEHVRQDLGQEVDVVLDGGTCEVGVESTILDLTREAPVLLRPGGVTVERIESLLGVKVSRRPPPEARAPGLLESHYAPRATVEVVSPSSLGSRAAELAASGRRVAVLVAGEAERIELAATPGLILLDLGGGADRAAQRLYAALREADAAGADTVLASLPRSSGVGEALVDRLTKAAGPRRHS